MELEIEGIVLRQVPYKEKDAMMAVLTEKGIASFYARGILSLTSKNASSCIIYAFSRFLLSSRGDKLTLRKGELITSYYQNYSSVNKMMILGVMSEIVFRISGDDDGRLYPAFKRILELLKDDFDELTLLCIFLAKAILYSGYSLQFEECYQCGSKRNIVAVDYINGGFVCAKCKKSGVAESPTYLKTYRYVFMVNLDNFNKVKLNQTVCKRLINEFLKFLKDKFGFYKFASEEMLKEIIK